jgi:hypothetical protein
MAFDPIAFSLEMARNARGGAHPLAWDNPGPTTDIGFSGSNIFLTVLDEDVWEVGRALVGTPLSQLRTLIETRYRVKPYLDTGVGGQVRYNVSGVDGVVTTDPGNGIRFIARSALQDAGYSPLGMPAHLAVAQGPTPGLAKSEGVKGDASRAFSRGRVALVAAGAVALAIGAALLRRR